MKRALLGFALLLALPHPGFGDDSTARLLARASEGIGAWQIAQHLSDSIGPRLSGSANAEKAVEWTAATMRSWGLDVRLQPVTVPHWVRGREEAKLTSPAEHSLAVTALGGSVATPRRGSPRR